jgi:hypothetical protein
MTVNPVRGANNTRLSLVRTENTGRHLREGYITVVKSGDTSGLVKDTCGLIQQNSRGLYLELQNRVITASIDDADNQGNIVLDVKGTTNANSFPNNFISFDSVVGATIVFEQLSVLGYTYTSLPVTLADDAGYEEAYNFTAKIRVTLASGATEASGNIVVRVGADAKTTSDSSSFRIQPTGQEYLRIPDDVDIITLSVLGETKNIPVSSNVSWEIEEL